MDINGNVIVVNEETLRGFAAEQKSTGAEEIALDFGHNSHVADKNPEKEPVKVAAYGVPVIEQGTGILMDMSASRWTPEGKEFYGEGHYRDVSPVLRFYSDGKTVKGVTSAALCRRGALEGLVAFSADLLNQPNTRDTAKKMENEQEPGPQTGENDDAAALGQMTKALADILGKLGVQVPKGASREDVLKAVAEWLQSSGKQASGGDAEKAFSAQLAGMQKQIDALTQDKEKTVKATLIDSALRAGKKIAISRETLEKAFSADQVKTYLDSLPEGEVAFSATSSREQGGGKAVMDVDEREAARQCGLTDEEYLKGRH